MHVSITEDRLSGILGNSFVDWKRTRDAPVEYALRAVREYSAESLRELNAVLKALLTETEKLSNDAFVARLAELNCDITPVAHETERDEIKAIVAEFDKLIRLKETPLTLHAAEKRGGKKK